ncbi:MAG: hypothetical protein MUF18_18295 [Fimbriiglobus sp.]|jgi:hypothetical protein|nr:hypothetical protein [Fimbriiglobus sp.]
MTQFLNLASKALAVVGVLTLMYANLEASTSKVAAGNTYPDQSGGHLLTPCVIYISGYGPSPGNKPILGCAWGWCGFAQFCCTGPGPKPDSGGQLWCCWTIC